MNQRQLNLMQSILDGIKLARKDLAGPGSLKTAMDAIEENFTREEFQSMSAGQIAYLACCWILWEDSGRPEFT